MVISPAAPARWKIEIVQISDVDEGAVRELALPEGTSSEAAWPG